MTPRVPIDVSINVVDSVPCPRAGSPRRCANLVLRSSIDQEGMAQMMARMLEGMNELQGMTYERLDVVTTVNLRLEIDTMLPHELTSTRIVDMTVLDDRKNRGDARQVDRRASRFTYTAQSK